MKERVVNRRYQREGSGLLISLSHIKFSPQNLEKECKTHKHIQINNHKDKDRYFILVW